MRKSGILLPIASLNSKYGIGCFSQSAYDFVDFLKKAGQSYWQILPIGPTGYGDSPYQSFSTFAGNPYYIDLEQFIKDGLLDKSECESCDFGNNERYIDYEKIFIERFNILKKAYKRYNFENDTEFVKFEKENSYWLDDYSLYMAIKDSFGGVSWDNWDSDISLRKTEAMKVYSEKLSDDIKFYKFIQYIFIKQWNKLKNYANDNGIKIIGDIPIYVAFDSADTWANPQLFQFDKNNKPIKVAGCPPDAFAEDGQLWGNPLYDWDYHKKTDYEWWIKRIQYCYKLYDVIRIDHFRGFDEYYAIPYGDKTARNGSWQKGVGYELFSKINEKLGDIQVIAEDLGYITDSVKKLVEDTGYPGMKVLQFAFDSREAGDYLPYNYNQNSVVYTGTHDNDTIKGWYSVINENDKKFANDYMNNQNIDLENISWDFIKLAFSSVSKLAIIPIQDYLCLGKESRINIPSTLGGNWTWRIIDSDINDKLAEKIYKVTKLYGRL